MRDFGLTAEPSGQVGRHDAAGMSFVVQQARRSTHALRTSGSSTTASLLSWAVPKGPEPRRRGTSASPCRPRIIRSTIATSRARSPTGQYGARRRHRVGSSARGHRSATRTRASRRGASTSSSTARSSTVASSSSSTRARGQETELAAHEAARRCGDGARRREHRRLPGPRACSPGGRSTTSSPASRRRRRHAKRRRTSAKTGTRAKGAGEDAAVRLDRAAARDRREGVPERGTVALRDQVRRLPHARLARRWRGVDGLAPRSRLEQAVRRDRRCAVSRPGAIGHLRR